MFFSPTGRLPRTIWPLLKYLCIFHPQLGRLEQLDHFKKIFIFFHQQAGRLEQLDHFKKKIFSFFTNKQVAWNNWITFEFLQKKKGEGFHAYFSLQNLLYKAKRK